MEFWYAGITVSSHWQVRYTYEDRWGGEMNWVPVHRGGDEV